VTGLNAAPQQPKHKVQKFFGSPTMPHTLHVLTPAEFQAELCSPVAFHRIKALHLLERLADEAKDSRLQREVSTFTGRGVPYYALHAPHFNAWVQQASGLYGRVRQQLPESLEA
jgi:hypothetical protein